MWNCSNCPDNRFSQHFSFFLVDEKSQCLNLLFFLSGLSRILGLTCRLTDTSFGFSYECWIWLMFIWRFFHSHIYIEANNQIDWDDSEEATDQCQWIGRQLGRTCSRWVKTNWAHLAAKPTEEAPQRNCMDPSHNSVQYRIILNQTAYKINIKLPFSSQNRRGRNFIQPNSQRSVLKNSYICLTTVQLAMFLLVTITGLRIALNRLGTALKSHQSFSSIYLKLMSQNNQGILKDLYVHLNYVFLLHMLASWQR